MLMWHFLSLILQLHQFFHWWRTLLEIENFHNMKSCIYAFYFAKYFELRFHTSGENRKKSVDRAKICHPALPSLSLLKQVFASAQLNSPPPPQWRYSHFPPSALKVKLKFHTSFLRLRRCCWTCFRLRRCWAWNYVMRTRLLRGGGIEGELSKEVNFCQLCK